MFAADVDVGDGLLPTDLVEFTLDGIAVGHVVQLVDLVLDATFGEETFSVGAVGTVGLRVDEDTASCDIGCDLIFD